MLRRFALSLVALVAAAAVVAPTFGSPTATRLNGTVGPGFTITLKKGTARVTTLKAGSYTFVVRDRSNIHDFALRGPVSRVITTVRFVGTKRVTLTLKRGRYTYVCRPHVSTMKGSFRVT